MANQEQVERLRSGVEMWNEWRRTNPWVKIDLEKANLSRANLSGANLSGRTLVGRTSKAQFSSEQTSAGQISVQRDFGRRI
jgi:uncharacterized protein YjbI with pentapeptide repeats